MMTRIGVTPPPGEYRGIFLDVTEFSILDFGGPACRWDFLIDQGENSIYTNATVSRMTEDFAARDNLCGKFLEMVMDLPFDEAIKRYTYDFGGRPGIIVVEESPRNAFVSKSRTIVAKKPLYGDNVRVARFIRRDIEYLIKNHPQRRSTGIRPGGHRGPWSSL